MILNLESKIPPAPNLSKIKPISWQICKFLHFSIPCHIDNKRLPWQHRRLMRIVITCKMTPIGVKLNFKNFILISYAVSELLRKVSQGGRNPPPPRRHRVKMGVAATLPELSEWILRTFTEKRGRWFRALPPPTVHLRADDVTWTYYTSR